MSTSRGEENTIIRSRLWRTLGSGLHILAIQQPLTHLWRFLKQANVIYWDSSVIQKKKKPSKRLNQSPCPERKEKCSICLVTDWVSSSYGCRLRVTSHGNTQGMVTREIPEKTTLGTTVLPQAHPSNTIFSYMLLGVSSRAAVARNHTHLPDLACSGETIFPKTPGHKLFQAVAGWKYSSGDKGSPGPWFKILSKKEAQGNCNKQHKQFRN